MTHPFQHLLVTGGCGFIGSNLVRYLLRGNLTVHVTNLDRLTYSGNPENLTDVAAAHGPEGDGRYRFVHGDIRDSETVRGLLVPAAEELPPVDAVVHLAAESHVDRSILGPLEFVSTNVSGTANLLESCRAVGDDLPPHFRFVHVSTDEVYGSLAEHDPPFTEDTPLDPSSPYSASKAGSDLLVGSFVHTFDFPAVVVRCSNNYGPFQYPEKLIPLMITRAMRDAPLPVYGDGLNVRDWIHVEDHCAALWAVLCEGRIGACYNVGGNSELTNLDIVRRILVLLGKPESLVSFVTDRPGHDRRYAMDIGRIRDEVGWSPRIAFDAGIEATLKWYQRNEKWWAPLLPESERVATELYRS